MPNHPESKPSAETTLARELRLRDPTAIVVGTIIGSGIFLVPGRVATHLDSLGAVLLVWLVGGVLSLCGALSIAEIGAAFPGAGGLYVYLRHAYGRPAGFLYGWGLLCMIHSGSIATLAVAFGLYLSQLLFLSNGEQKAVGVGCILILTYVNCLGIRPGKLVQNLLTVIKLGGLSLMTLLLFARGRPLTSLAGDFWPEGPLRLAWLPFGAALVAVLWAYEGWHVVSFAAGEIKQPTRDLPRSLFHGTLIITGSYLLANAAYYSVLSGAEIRQGDTVAATAMSQAFGPIASGLVSLLILVSIFGAMNGMVLTGPRVYYAMAKEGLFFNAFSQLNARYRTPIVAIVVQGIWASLLTLLGTFQELFTYVIFTAWIFYGLTVAGVIVLRHKQPALERPFRVPAFPWLPAFFCLAAFGITVSTIVADPHHALLGIALILAGLPVYALFRRRATLPGASPGNQSH
jgi:APA family basic amino acid/polyamine antiporter